jgi:hypothetical protein
VPLGEEAGHDPAHDLLVSHDGPAHLRLDALVLLVEPVDFFFDLDHFSEPDSDFASDLETMERKYCLTRER